LAGSADGCGTTRHPSLPDPSQDRGSGRGRTAAISLCGLQPALRGALLSVGHAAVAGALESRARPTAAPSSRPRPTSPRKSAQRGARAATGAAGAGWPARCGIGLTAPRLAALRCPSAPLRAGNKPARPRPARREPPRRAGPLPPPPAAPRQLPPRLGAGGHGLPRPERPGERALLAG
jgi:hypothetical protein